MHGVEQPEAERTNSYSGSVQSLGNGEHQGAYGDLASVKEVVDLSPQAALDETQTFLIRQGYRTVHRRGESLTVQRRSPNQTVGQNTLNLTVTALHQPGGGVRINVRGNDKEGVRERQSAWAEWSDTLPKKQAMEPSKAAEEQQSMVGLTDRQGEVSEGPIQVSKLSPKSHRDHEPNVYEQIRSLAELRDDGLLTSKEFETKKRELLERL
jgi:hypothetical protein